MLDTASADNLYKNMNISRAAYIIQLNSIYSNYCNDYSMGIIRIIMIFINIKTHFFRRPESSAVSIDF
jgi:hypothetical protein